MTGVADKVGKVTAGVYDTGGNFVTGVIDTGDKKTGDNLSLPLPLNTSRAYNHSLYKYSIS